MQPGDLILQNGDELTPAAARWLIFRDPREVIRADRPGEVRTALERVGRAVGGGRWAAGMMAYEAAAGIDPAFGGRADAPLGGLPLVWFGIYDAPQALDEPPPPADADGFRLSPWRPSLTPGDYAAQLERIRAWIAAGDTYQVNFTYPLRARFEGDPLALLAALGRAQPTGFGALLRLPDHLIASASPELFFAQEGDRVLARPMKGTARRGRWPEEDARRAAALTENAKDRAENVMIVDLLRNDLGRLAIPGSVRVEELFAVERYPTLLQMTSTISARTEADPVAVLEALFPCGSVTGAPKIRTTRIIAELEDAARGIYTGAIGWIAPGRRARFSVAIRTLQVDLEEEASAGESLHGQATFGVGGGITWYSDPQAEHREALTKAAMVLEPRPAFRLLESMLRRPDDDGRGGEIYLLERHLDRLRDSAAYFDFPFDRQRIVAEIESGIGRLPAGPHKLRLLLAAGGDLELQCEPVGTPHLDPFAVCAAPPRRVGLALAPVDSADPFLFHKTTHRRVYGDALASRPEMDDVLLFNERGELTEASSSNIVVAMDGELFTPPRECGLLAGTVRAQWLAEGRLAERVLRPDDLERAEAIWLVNSVRGWMPAVLVEPSATTPVSSSTRGGSAANE
jgi:para-aminobenzoate synthetase/4-amino-4-deoxychorismate lyase